MAKDPLNVTALYGERKALEQRDFVAREMRRRFGQLIAPLCALFGAVCLLILLTYHVVDQNLSCQCIPEERDTDKDYARSATKAPELEAKPKLVVILTCQRCGSTFFGQLFNENPDAFYMFEPLASLYSAMYGTKHGWSSLSDITSYQNGSQRILPEEEIRMISQFVSSLLLCDVYSLPTETLNTRFSSKILETNKYTDCVRRIRLNPTTNCSAHDLSSLCGTRFGEKSEEVLTDCRRAITDKNYRLVHKNRTIFAEYIRCIKDLRDLLDEQCSSIWQSTCSSRSFRAVKLVRATMDSMEPLLRILPNLRIIHLIRDPRAVVLSRKRFSSSVRGLYTERDPKQTLSREAYTYCRTVANDVRRRKELEAIYPGKIFSLLYDDVVQALGDYIQDVYRFLGTSVPENVWTWFRKNNYPMHYGGRMDSAAIATHWEDGITVRQSKKIEAVCKEFFQGMKYPWAKLSANQRDDADAVNQEEDFTGRFYATGRSRNLDLQRIPRNNH